MRWVNPQDSSSSNSISSVWRKVHLETRWWHAARVGHIQASTLSMFACRKNVEESISYYVQSVGERVTQAIQLSRSMIYSNSWSIVWTGSGLGIILRLEHSLKKLNPCVWIASQTSNSILILKSNSSPLQCKQHSRYGKTNLHSSKKSTL